MNQGVVGHGPRGMVSLLSRVGSPPLSAWVVLSGVYLTIVLAEGLRWGGERGLAWWVDSGWTGAGVLALLACVHTARRVRGADRQVWMLIAVGCASWLVGQLAWDAGDLVASLPPAPNLADIGFLGFVPAVLAALPAIGRGRRLVWALLGLDMAVLGCAFALLSLTVFWGRIHASLLTAPETVTALLYPTLYAILACALILLPLRQAWRSASLRLLLIGVMAQVCAAILWAPMILAGHPSRELPLTMLAMGGMVCIALGARRFERFPAIEAEALVHGPSAALPLALSFGAALVVLAHFLPMSLPDADRDVLDVLLTAMLVSTALRLALTLIAGKRLFDRVSDTAAALRQSEAQYRLLAENATDMIVRQDAQGRYIYVSPACRHLLGYEPEELLGHTPFDFYHPDDLERARAMQTDIDRPDTETVTFAARRRRKDGGYVWLETVARVTRDPASGVIYEITSVSRDITERKRAEELLRVSEATYREMFESTLAVKLLIDPATGTIVDANAAASAFYGCAREDLRGMPLGEINMLSPEELTEQMAAVVSGVQPVFLRRHRLSSGEIRDVEVRSSAVRIQGRQLLYSIIHDVTDRKRAENAVAVSEARYRILVETSPDAILLLRHDDTILMANVAGCRMFGYEHPRDLVGLNALDLFALEDLPRGADEMEDSVVGRSNEQTLRRRDGERFWAEMHTEAILGAEGQVEAQMVVIRDVTDRRKFEQQLRYQALHDALTGLPNRTLFQDRLEQAIRTAHRSARSLALLLLDVDRFKQVNDTLGHHTGDHLLQEVAHRLQTTLRDSDTVARLGGDEFAVILPVIDADGAYGAAAKIRTALQRPLVLDAHSIDLDASIGIALYPVHGGDAGTLLRHADVAMYAAKRAGGGQALYTPDHDFTSPRRLALVADLRRAIEEGQLLLHYQPKVHIRTGSPEHMEALVRWLHPEHGLIAPADFIPIAEETGLIEPLTLWVLRTALEQCAVWSRADLSLSVAVNLSTRNLYDPHLPDTVAWMLRSADVSPSSLILEITESALMSDSERSLAILRQLHEMGVRISVDDFGTGYSSLAYLKQLPVDEIKVDRSFVSGTTRNGTVIIRSVVDLGRNLGLEVTAEGVENYETWELLSRMGCDLAQGYYLSRPLPADEVVPWIAAYDRKMRSQSRQRGRQSTILVVDDNPVYQQLLQALLSEEGYSVMLTESAEEALRLLHTARPHLILADVQLAGMSGLELARQIKANPTLQETVMVVMTGAPRPEDEQYARSIGCDHYIAKPNTNAELLALVRRSLAA